jgi:hypothetical protein
LVAAQVGPPFLLLIRSPRRHGAPVGLAIGAGAEAPARQRARGAWPAAVDAVSGLGLVVFGGALGVRTVRAV